MVDLHKNKKVCESIQKLTNNEKTKILKPFEIKLKIKRNMGKMENN